MNDIYIHYGHKKFNNRLWNEVKNCNFVKPIGGLWASKIDATFGWKDWCNSEKYMNCVPSNSFNFRLKSSAKLLVINNIDELQKQPKNSSVPLFMNDRCYYLDFERLKQIYDAIEVNISNDKRLYWDLYGWDCDSILILNKDAIEIINIEEVYYENNQM